MKKQIWMLSIILLAGCSGSVDESISSLMSDEFRSEYSESSSEKKTEMISSTLVSSSESSKNNASSENLYDVPGGQHVEDDWYKITLTRTFNATFEDYKDFLFYLSLKEGEYGIEKIPLLKPVDLLEKEPPYSTCQITLSYTKNEDGTYEDMECMEIFSVTSDAIGNLVGETEDATARQIDFRCMFYPTDSSSEIESKMEYISRKAVKFTFTQDDDVVGYVFADFYGLEVTDYVKDYIDSNLELFTIKAS